MLWRDVIAELAVIAVAAAMLAWFALRERRGLA